MHSSLRNIHIKSAHWIVNARICRDLYPVKSVTVGGNLSPRTFLTEVDYDDREPCYVGVVMQNDIANNRPPLTTLIREGYVSFAQMDVLDVRLNRSIKIFPQFEMLDELIKHYPNAHFIHTRREFTESHVASINAWNGLLNRLNSSGFLNNYPGQSSTLSTFENGKIFVEKVTEITLNAFKKRPDIKFLDLCIDCENANVNEKIKNFLNLTTFEYIHQTSGKYKDKRTG